MPAKIPNALMIKALIMAAGVAGPNIKVLEYDKLARINGWPSVSAIQNRFGGWDKAKERAGIIENKTFCDDCLESEDCCFNDLKDCPYYDESDLYFKPIDI